MTKLKTTLNQFEKALARFSEAVKLEKSELVRDAAIKRFEFTMDLAWKTLKAFLEEKLGIIANSPKECLRQAYAQQLIEYEDAWLKLVDLRNETVHTYNQETAEQIYSELPEALSHFEKLLNVLKERSNN